MREAARAAFESLRRRLRLASLHDLHDAKKDTESEVHDLYNDLVRTVSDVVVRVAEVQNKMDKLEDLKKLVHGYIKSHSELSLDVARFKAFLKGKE